MQISETEILGGRAEPAAAVVDLLKGLGVA